VHHLISETSIAYRLASFYHCSLISSCKVNMLYSFSHVFRHITSQRMVMRKNMAIQVLLDRIYVVVVVPEMCLNCTVKAKMSL